MASGSLTGLKERQALLLAFERNGFRDSPRPCAAGLPMRGRTLDLQAALQGPNGLQVPYPVIVM